MPPREHHQPAAGRGKAPRDVGRSKGQGDDGDRCGLPAGLHPEDGGRRPVTARGHRTRPRAAPWMRGCMGNERPAARCDRLHGGRWEHHMAHRRNDIPSASTSNGYPDGRTKEPRNRPRAPSPRAPTTARLLRLTSAPPAAIFGRYSIPSSSSSFDRGASWTL